MSAGDVLLIPLLQIGGTNPKPRPVLLLAELPGPFENCLVCGISTQMQQLQPNWDELIRFGDSDFSTSGLHHSSAVRLSYLYAADSNEIAGTIGRIDSSRLKRLRQQISDHLKP